MKTRLTVCLISFLFVFVKCDKTEYEVWPENGMLAYYPFSGNAFDESWNMHDGTIYGAEFRDDRAGRQNQALFFDGTDDIVKLDKMDSFNSSLKSFSVSFWIKSDTSDVFSYKTIMKTINNDPAGNITILQP
jgi:hypothetical protein